MNKDFICKFDKCKKYLVDPVLLECASNVCKSHLDEMVDQSGDEFKCFICNEYHHKPHEAFKINIPLKNMIKLELDLKENQKKVSQIAQKLKLSEYEIANVKNKPLISNYILDIRAKINSERNKLFEDINILSDEMLNNLKLFEEECKEKLVKLGLPNLSNFSNVSLAEHISKSTILSQNQFMDLIKLCEFNSQTRFKLLYQATRDGFSNESFHSKCDNIPNTLSLVKVKGSLNVFGGYSSVPWDQSCSFKCDPKAFIFSFINKHNLPMKFPVCEPFQAVYCHKMFGLEYGHDIHIHENSNTNLKSYSNFGFIYQNDAFPYKSIDFQCFMGGSKKFKTVEIEIYQVL